MRGGGDEPVRYEVRLSHCSKGNVGAPVTSWPFGKEESSNMKRKRVTAMKDTEKSRLNINTHIRMANKHPLLGSTAVQNPTQFKVNVSPATCNNLSLFKGSDLLQ